MTLKDLQKIILDKTQNQTIQAIEHKKQFFSSLEGLPFWIWQQEEHKAQYAKSNGKCCCFNHAIGLPVKEYPRPLYDFQQLIIDAIEQHRLVWLNKSRGNGSSELLLRYLAYLAIVRAAADSRIRDSQMCILTGPRLELAVSLIVRLKKLFERHNIFFDSKETVIQFPHTGVRVEAFPSMNISSMRGLPNVSAIVADEFAFVGSEFQARESLAVCEGYLAKNRNVIILFMSTSNRPDDVFMELGKPGSIYHPLRIDWTYGLDRIYSREEIELAKKSSSFRREFELEPLGQEGTLFSQLAIGKAIELGKSAAAAAAAEPDAAVYNPAGLHSMGIDAAWGDTSNFAITVLQAYQGRISVLYSAEFSHPDYTQMLHHVIALMKRYHRINTIRIDAANPEFVASLKSMLNERRDFNEHIASLKKQFPYTPIERFIRVVPVPFNTEGRKMLGTLKAFIEDDRGLVAIHPQFTTLIMALRGAVAEETNLIKAESAYNDSLDSMRLAISYFQYQPVGGTR